MVDKQRNRKIEKKKKKNREIQREMSKYCIPKTHRIYRLESKRVTKSIDEEMWIMSHVMAWIFSYKIQS